MKSICHTSIKELSSSIFLILFLAACGQPVAEAGLTKVTGPTGNLSAITFIPYNSSTPITWSSASDAECTLTGDGAAGAAGTTGKSGSFNTPRLKANTTYTLTCGSGSQTITINVASSAVASAITAFADAGPGNVTVVSINTLTNGTQITISGTTSYNGTYVVASRTDANFVIAKTFVTGSENETGYWQLAGGMIYGCSTTATTGSLSAINLANYKASRYTGVAPLSVILDASDTTTDGTVTTLPFHEIEYKWDFGDIDPVTKALNLSPPAPFVGGTSTWNMGSKPGVNSRNAATGPVAAHVYETPGVYNVALTANDGTNKVSNSCAQIVVLSPDTVFPGTNTICIAQNTTPVAGVDGCPAGAAVSQQSNFATAINTYALTGKRVLFKRGDTFTGTTSAALTRTGPGIVGAYGTGAKPIINTTSTSGTMFTLGNATVAVMLDWRIMDLEFAGQSKAGVTIMSAAYNADQMLFLRVNMHDAGSIFFYNTGILHVYDGVMHLWTENFLVDSVLERAIGGGGNAVAFVAGSKMAFLGNFINDSTGAEHVMRIQHAAKSVFSNNTFSNAANGKQVFTLRGVSYTSYNCNQSSGTAQCLPIMLPYNSYSALTSQTVVSGNKFISGISGQPIDIHPSDSNYFDTRFEDILFERNWYVSSAGGCCLPMLNIQAQKVTIRNEVMEISAGDWHRAFAVSGAGTASPASTDVRVYNNTIYSSASNHFQAGVIDAGVTGAVFKNNIFYAPNINGTTSLTNSTYTNNSTNTQTNAYFTAVPPTSPADFKITAGSYAIGGGVVVPVWSDFFSVPLTSTRDMGAVMH